MIPTGATNVDQSTIGVFPDGGRSVWLMGMLITFKAISAETGGAYSLYLATIPPHVGAPPHIHHRETEAFYLLEGELQFIVGERTLQARAGDFIHVNSGVVHGYTNVGAEIVRYVGIVTPGGLHEQLFAALGEEAIAETLPPPPAGPPDMPRLIELAGTYGTELLPPPGR